MKDKEKYIDYLELGTLVFLFCISVSSLTVS